MRRLFGVKKQPEGPSLQEAQERLDGRSGSIEQKIKKLDTELAQLREQMKKVRPGPGQNALKQKALRLLKQKKMYEAQLDQMMNQSFNMEQQLFATQTLKDTITTVGAMKQGAAEMKKQFKHVSIDQVENLHDELQDLLEDNEEIQSVLSRNYALEGMDIDENELEAELDALGELETEDESIPSYLQTTTVPTATPQANSAVDDFGLPLPAVPQTI
jgi:charged multivesicular body protein 5